MPSAAHQMIPEYKDDFFRRLQSSPTIEGKIKAKPEEFLVSEVLLFEPEGLGEHLYLQIEKRPASN